MTDFARYQFTVVDGNGNVVPNANVRVKHETVGQPLAAIFSDRTGQDALANPFQADSDGFAAFHVAGGAYQIEAYAEGFSRTFNYVGIGLSSETDIAAQTEERLTIGELTNFPTSLVGNFHGLGYDSGDDAPACFAIKTSASGALFPAGLLTHRDTTGVDDYVMGFWDAYCLNDADEPIGCGLHQTLRDASAGTEDSSFEVVILSGGALVTALRVDPDGIKFNNDTAAANALDDYEQGSFSPTLTTTGVNFTSVTYDALRNGAYTKIGNTVHFTLLMFTDAVTVGSASGTVLIGNLPFTSLTQDACAVSQASAWAGEEPIAASIVASSATIQLYYRPAVDTADTATAVADVGTGSNSNLILISGRYMVS